MPTMTYMTWLKTLCFVTELFRCLTNANDVTEFKIGVPIITNAGTPYDIERVGAAIQMGFDKVNSEVLNSSYRLVKIERHYGTSCSASGAPGVVADLYHMDGIVGLIGPACTHALEPVGELAYYWNIPIVTGLGDSGQFEDKTAFPILTRLAYCQCRIRQVFGSVFLQFHWVDIALIYDFNDYHSNVLGESLRDGLQKQRIYPYVITFYGNSDHNCHQMLQLAATRSREHLRQFMLAAMDLGYITNGEFVFMDVELFPFPGSYWGDHSWKRGDALDERAKLAYTALLRIALDEPTSVEWVEFTKNVKQLSQEMYNFTFGSEKVNFFVGAFHDAVYLYGLALNETLTEGRDPRDGYQMTKQNMWNRSFTGVSGEVLIDYNGDRKTTYTILDMNPTTGNFQVVAVFGGDSQVYDPHPSKKIHWSGGRVSPPPNEPLCGFLGDKCSIDEGLSSSSVVLIALMSVMVLIIAFLGCALRIYRRERAIQSMSWLVLSKDIKNYKNTNGFSKLSVEKDSNLEADESLNDANSPEQLFTNVCTYKGTLVVFRKLSVHKLEMKRSLMLELKQMQDIHHANLVKFIGACLEPGCVCILSEYCSKGSLQDVLYNDEITLDWTFRISLLKDISAGISYIHGSDIRYHGNLRSSNCVIDGRFVVKLTDFGLRGISDIMVRNSGSANSEQRLLWVAPEILRAGTSPGSREGDVYSFGIIIDEVSARAGPYSAYTNQMEVAEILKRVKQGVTPPFRPKIVNTECPGKLERLAAQCWTEVPAFRPSVQVLQKQLKSLLCGHADNLVDALLRRMEQYASNLEQIVQERTQQLLVEKRRSDELLYQILPSWPSRFPLRLCDDRNIIILHEDYFEIRKRKEPVAERLKTGQAVIPEAFESVTVYFSDIVGFTAMSSLSTPFQIVDFLNDLYTVFDSTIENYNVYKVETIGDAYMVVSGLPLRNGDHHAPEICRLALGLLAQTKTFVIKHMPSELLQIRIGIHSGPCVAGVVGLKMPRYCLFGDTVNTASRMESNGEAQMIHISKQTKELLDQYPMFQTEYRGQVDAKGKGLIDTFWLLNGIEEAMKT